MRRISPLFSRSLTQSLTVKPCINRSISIRQFSSFLDSESDDIFREIEELKKSEAEKKKAKLAAQGLTIDENGQLVPITAANVQAAQTEKPRGGPSVEAILRLRRTGEKVDPDELNARWEKIQNYKRTKKLKESNEQSKLP